MGLGASIPTTSFLNHSLELWAGVQVLAIGLTHRWLAQIFQQSSTWLDFYRSKSMGSLNGIGGVNTHDQFFKPQP